MNTNPTRYVIEWRRPEPGELVLWSGRPHRTGHAPYASDYRANVIVGIDPVSVAHTAPDIPEAVLEAIRSAVADRDDDRLALIARDVLEEHDGPRDRITHKSGGAVSTVLEDSQRYLRALDGATDPMAPPPRMEPSKASEPSKPSTSSPATTTTQHIQETTP